MSNQALGFRIVAMALGMKLRNLFETYGAVGRYETSDFWLAYGAALIDGNPPPDYEGPRARS